jgi:hypothetical protein
MYIKDYETEIGSQGSVRAVVLLKKNRVLTMVYNTQNYWVLGLCPSSVILETIKQRFGKWICFRPQVRGETPTLLRPL